MTFNLQRPGGAIITVMVACMHSSRYGVSDRAIMKSDWGLISLVNLAVTAVAIEVRAVKSEVKDDCILISTAGAGLGRLTLF